MTIPLHKLASLDLLKGFVAAGRRMSITLAADDLCITQSAMSRQIHALEEAIGYKVFVRKHRGIDFTDSGERLFRSADGALQQLQDVMTELARNDEAGAVTISASIGVAGLWLLPKMRDFQQAHPAIEIRLSANNRLSDLRSDGIDLAIRYCAAVDAPEGAIRLFDEVLMPVANPSILSSTDDPDILLRVPLIEFDDSRPWFHWKNWLQDRDWKLAKKNGVIKLNQYDQVIHAALAGQGLAIGRTELIHPLLASGSLVVPKLRAHAFQSPNSYWLSIARSDPRPDVRTVARWIEAEAGKVRRLQHREA